MIRYCNKVHETTLITLDVILDITTWACYNKAVNSVAM